MVGLYRDGLGAAGPHKISLGNESPARTVLLVTLFAAGNQ